MEIISVARAIELNPLSLAFVGDAYYTLFVRQGLTAKSDYKANELDKAATKVVNAEAQARLFEFVEGILTQHERDIARRARNSHTNNRPKSCSPADYKKATALEAVLGFLAITGNYQRIEDILNSDGESE